DRAKGRNGEASRSTRAGWRRAGDRRRRPQFVAKLLQRGFVERLAFEQKLGAVLERGLVRLEDPDRSVERAVDDFLNRRVDGVRRFGAVAFLTEIVGGRRAGQERRGRALVRHG